MDRDAARFVADALEARLNADASELEALATTSVARLMGGAQAIRRMASAWAPAVKAAAELEAIVRLGGKAADTPADPDVKIFVDKLRALAAEPPQAMPRNRHERRAKVKIQLPRRERLVGIRPLVTVQ